MRSFRAVCAACAALWLAGCASGPSGGPRPGLTKIGSKPVVLPARLAGNALVVSAKGGRNGPYHFLVDTGSSRTLVSPELIQELGSNTLTLPRQLTVRSADGKAVTLPTGTIARLSLGNARFDDVPVLVYDCSALSAEFGVKIDGILGFSFFRQTILTLDYPHAQVILRSITSHVRSAGTSLPLIMTNHVPVITVHLGERPVGALIDSGNRDIALSVNRAFAGPSDFAFGPIDGLTVHDLVGDHRQRIGRLAATLQIADYSIARPIAELTDDLSALGGGLLKFFTITFDQEGERVIFNRESPDPIVIPPLRSAGISFSRVAAYWRVAGVVPGSPAERAGVAEGDLVTKIAGEPVRQWDKERFNALLAAEGQVKLTFLQGTKEMEKTLPVSDLVP